MIFLLFASAAFMALCPRLSQLRAKKSSSNPKHGSSRAAPSPAKQFVGSGRALQPQSLGLSTSSLGLSAHILSLGLSSLSSPYFCWCGLSSPYPFFGAIQPIFFWCGLSSPFLWSYPAHILLGLPSPYSFGAVQPISFPWGCPALYPFFGAIQPISFPWGCPANIFSLGLSSPYLFFW